MFKQAIIYYPTDERIMKQINKDIAAFHCAAAVKYMNTLNLNDRQKVTLIDSIRQDLSAKPQQGRINERQTPFVTV